MNVTFLDVENFLNIRKNLKGTRTNFNYHINYHIKNFNYHIKDCQECECDIPGCGKLFKHKKKLERHKNKFHLCFKCEVCSKVFAEKRNLKRHKCTHKWKFRCENGFNSVYRSWVYIFTILWHFYNYSMQSNLSWQKERKTPLISRQLAIFLPKPNTDFCPTH